MARLIHLNGPPGIGKSTLARRYVDEHPGVLNCDVDVLRTLIGGWQADFKLAGALIRSAALAMISAYLAQGRDVVYPQMRVDPSELAKFEACAHAVGARFVECMLMDTQAAAVERFHRRGQNGAHDPGHTHVRTIVDQLGGDEILVRSYAGLQALLDQRSTARANHQRGGPDRRHLSGIRRSRRVTRRARSFARCRSAAGSTRRNGETYPISSSKTKSSS